MRKTLATYGPFGRRVRVFLAGDRVVVQWWAEGCAKQQSWPATRAGQLDAKTWARSFADRRSGIAVLERPTLRALWERYWAAEAEHLRPRSQIRYRERWSWWERFVGREAIAEDVTIETAGRFRRELEGLGKASNQVRLILGVVRVVYNWAQRAKLVRENPLAAYRFKRHKDAPKNEPAEYRRADFEQLVQQFKPQDGRDWRASCALLLIGNQGVRENAALRLRWSDVDLAGGRITWPAVHDKMGREWAQPIRLEAYAALLTAQWWRQRIGYAGPWVFPAARSRRLARGEPFTAQGLWYQLRAAEDAAGVPHLELRSAHGFRRMVVNDILVETHGDLEAAAQFIGDHDLRVVRGSYRREREDELAGLASRLDQTVMPPQRETPPQRQGRRRAALAGSSESHRSDLNRRPPDFKAPASAEESPPPRVSGAPKTAETGEARPNRAPRPKRHRNRDHR